MHLGCGGNHCGNRGGNRGGFRVDFLIFEVDSRMDFGMDSGVDFGWIFNRSEVCEIASKTPVNNPPKIHPKSTSVFTTLMFACVWHLFGGVQIGSAAAGFEQGFSAAQLLNVYIVRPGPSLCCEAVSVEIVRHCLHSDI